MRVSIRKTAGNYNVLAGRPSSGPAKLFALGHPAKCDKRRTFTHGLGRSRRLGSSGANFPGLLGNCVTYVVIESFNDPGLSTRLTGFFLHSASIVDRI